MNATRHLGILMTALLAVACGSKSPLLVPEPVEDAGVVTDAGTDSGVDSGTDAGPMPDECIELPFMDPPSELRVSFVAQIQSAEIFFLVDVTGSMSDEIMQIRENLRTVIVPGLADSIPDIRIGVGHFADFPEPGLGYGADGDEVFRLLQAQTNDLERVQIAVDDLPLQSGSDTPESMVEALYQVATGDGIGEYVRARSCAAGLVGYPCFREGEPPIILAFTDAPSHNGPGGDEPYSGIFPRPHTYDETVAALRGIGAKVLGLNSGDFGETGRAHLTALARDTGAVRPDGTPLVFDIGGDGRELGASVIEAVRILVEEVPIDVDVVLEDFPGDEVDATSFVQEIIAFEARPADGAIPRGDRFDEVRPGTRVEFRILLANDRIPQTDVAQSFFLNVALRGDGVNTLRETVVQIAIPPRGGGVVCP